MSKGGFGKDGDFRVNPVCPSKRIDFIGILTEEIFSSVFYLTNPTMGGIIS